MKTPTYPVRGFLHSLLEGSTDIEEAEEAILGFIAHAQDRAWREGVRVGTTHNPYKSEKPYQSLLDMEPV